jgi:DNA-binding NtrC family response regulator
MSSPRILVVDDESKMRRILELMLNPDGYSIDLAEDGRQALALLEQHSYDLVITDLKMPNLDGMEMIRMIKKIPIDSPVIVITAFGSVESAVEAMKFGAFDYITKPFEKEMIRIVVSKAIAYSTLRKENAYLREEVLQSYAPPEFVGNSPKMRTVYELVSQVAGTTSTVLITGESGTGKELLARAIHHGSARANGPFIAVNCASIPDTLLESEFFGFEKGAFTGADRSKPGKFELADGGSLFLDEIAEMSPSIQAKLLRVLQEKSFERLGGLKTIGVDIRFITATNKNLEELVERKLFRQDLYYRLNVFPIVVPPLRERKEDIPLLAAHFIAKFSHEMGKIIQGISQEAVNVLASYPWPGNVRELQNVIERAVILCRNKELTPAEINLLSTESTGAHDTGFLQRLKMLIPSHGISLDEIEKGLITAALQMSGNNQVRAAGLLKITRNTLRYRMEKFGIPYNGV